MESFKLFTIHEQSFEVGIDLSRYDSTISSGNCLTGDIAAYPLYPQKEFSSKAQTMLPISLSYVIQAKDTNAKSKQGIILQIDSSQWLPLNTNKDKSILLDVSQSFILLFCPVGGTYLRSVNKKKPMLLQVTQKCQPIITQQNNVKLEMTSLGKGFVTPVFNSEATAILQKKLRCKAAAKSPKTSPVEAALGKAASSS